MIPSPGNFNFYKNDRNANKSDTKPELISELVKGAKYNLDEEILKQEGKKFEISKQSGQKDPTAPYKPVSVIVYRDGILFTGEDTLLGFKIGKKWKQLLFEDMQSIVALEDALNITLNDDYRCNFKPELKPNHSKNMETWNAFLCFVDGKISAFSRISSSLNGHRKLCTAKSGGRRKTKRSKRTIRTRRNKKCKHRTRRS
jgi:hypothetical protein